MNRDRQRIVIGGAPQPEEIAAVLAALDGPGDDGARPAPRPAWQEAARRESVGLGTVRSRWDLVRPTG